MLWKTYRVVATAEEALKTLDLHQGKARIIAGGTDLIPRLKEREMEVECVVDITGIEDLKKIETDGNRVMVGAAVTHHQVVTSSLLRREVPLLVEAAAEIGTPQIRNQGTVLGNIMNSQPAADAAVSLLALGAEVRVVSQGGSNWLPLADLYEGVGVSRVKSDREFATEVRCQVIQKNQGWAYLRMRGRNDQWLPTLNTAVVITAKGKKFISGSIVIAPVSPRPFRARKAEEMMRGSSLTEKTIGAIAQKASEEASPRDSLLRGSSEYRKEIVSVLVRDALRKAVRNLKRDEG
jgi:CO/xanthine dehydrogenase FAD-binding subunit